MDSPAGAGRQAAGDQPDVKSISEANRWLRDAEVSLASGQRALEGQDYRLAVQNAQLCVEHSAKAVIAQLAEPLWRHDPSSQLRHLLQRHERIIILRCGDDMPDALRQLARDAEQAAPWHEWSTYGRGSEQGWLAAVDVCTQKTAEELLQRAQTYKHFFLSFGSWRYEKTGIGGLALRETIQKKEMHSFSAKAMTNHKKIEKLLRTDITISYWVTNFSSWRNRCRRT
ncbi:MAG: HEPN domain-containing protein [Candidatus Hodarchaeota archaeon]